jgi:hypothetical protein
MEFKKDYTVEIKLSQKDVKSLLRDYKNLTGMKKSLLSIQTISFLYTNGD